MGETTVEFTMMTEDMAVKIMDDFELAQKAIFVLMSGAHSTEERDGFRIVSYTCSRWQEKQWEIQYEGLPDGIEVVEEELKQLLLGSDSIRVDSTLVTDPSLFASFF